MNLVTRGRLSIQRVGEDAWNAVTLMAEKGGFDALNVKAAKVGKAGKASDTEDAWKEAQREREEEDRRR
jgi:hypothetical protein